MLMLDERSTDKLSVLPRELRGLIKVLKITSIEIHWVTVDINSRSTKVL